MSRRDATHNCYAYRIESAYRYSDDGEPGGTAGRPILAAIEGLGFDHIAVLVTRYYGGTKLGTGGLVRAYGGSASACLRNANTKLLEPKTLMTVEVPFDCTAGLYSVLDEFDHDRIEEEYSGAGVVLKLAVNCDIASKFENRMIDISRGRAQVSWRQKEDN